MFINYVIVFIFGLFLGSFLNLVGDRIVNGGSILYGRSKCDGCGMKLKPKHLIPLFSFIVQKGKCSNCSMKLSLTYPLSELLAGLAMVFAAAYSGLFMTEYSLGSVLLFIYLAIVLSVYIILFMTDLKYQLIPNGVVYFGIVFVFILTIVFQGYAVVSLRRAVASDDFGKYLLDAGFMRMQYGRVFKSMMKLWLSSLILAGFFQFLIVITKGRGMGGGDVKLALLIGLFNGYPNNVLAVFLGFVIGALYSVVLMTMKRKGMKDTIAFGPFLIIGSVISYVWGTQFLEWYLGLRF